MSMVPLGEFMPSRIPSVNPAKHPDEVFELWSIPAFDEGKPEVVPGSEIGSSKKCVEPGDVLLSRIVPHIRRSWVVSPATENRQIASGEWITFRSDEFDGRYMRHMLTSDPFHVEFMKTVAGVGGSLLRARPEGVKQIKIPLPPLEEQRRIAGILDQADALRRLRTRALDKLNTLGQAIFHEMFGDPVANSMGWDVVPIGNLGVVQGGLQVSRKREIHALRKPYLRVANVFRDLLDLAEVKEIGLTESEFERVKLQVGDILIVEGHGNPEEIGRTSVWTGEIEECVHQNHLIRFRADKSLVLPEFLSCLLNSPSGRRRLNSTSNTTSGLNTISTKKVKEAEVPLPPLAKQAEFLERFSASRAETKIFNAATQRFEDLFASLQHRAFQGEL